MRIISKAWAWLVARWPFDGRDALALVGFVSLVYGVSLVSSAAGLIVAGALLLTAWAAPLLPTRKKGT